MENYGWVERNSAEDIVRKLRRADELTAVGKSQEEIAGELKVSAATLYTWRRQYGGMDTDAAKEPKELCGQNSRLKRLLADPELEKDAFREVARGNFRPGGQASRGGHARHNDEAIETVGVQSSWAAPVHLWAQPDRADARRS